MPKETYNFYHAENGVFFEDKEYFIKYISAKIIHQNKTNILNRVEKNIVLRVEALGKCK